MDTTTVLLIVIVAAAVAMLVIAAVALILTTQSKHTGRLRSEFGPEYDRAVDEHGSRSGAEKELEARQKRVSALKLHPLTADQHAYFTESWKTAQARFVEDPHAAINQADSLVNAVMAARGYPVDSFEQRAADISVDHPRVVENYRAAHGVALRQREGDATTEELRRGMVHYRGLFEDLVGEPGDSAVDLPTARADDSRHVAALRGR